MASAVLGEQGGSGWEPPELFEEYRLLRPLGQGGMGQVYLAQDELLDRLVAVKFIASIQPDELSRQRFLIEARAIARLQHPNVVAIYRVGEVEGRPYLVSEFVRGKSLSRIGLPVPWERVLQIGLGISRGLSAAHRRGVLHRDIKPANAILTDQDEVKLLDFGLAKFIEPLSRAAPFSSYPPRQPARPIPLDAGDRLTIPGAVVGTPLYMAPEVECGEAATARSDLYSLGAVLYELCVGRPPALMHRPIDVADPDSSGSTQERPSAPGPPGPPRLSEVAPSLDSRFSELVDRCLETDPRRRFASADELCSALDLLAAGPRAASVPAGNPYRGLLPFAPEHRAVFFGRGAEIYTIAEMLKSQPIVLVAGDSGVGKSSICEAGVLPACVDGALDPHRVLSTISIYPGRRPLSALAAATAPLLGVPEEAVLSWMRADPSLLSRALRQLPSRSVLLFVDQLEELITLSDPKEAALCGEVLGHFSLRAPGVRLLLCARGDFLTRLAVLPGLGDEIPSALYLLRPMSAPSIREVIVGPARQKGVSFESDALIDILVESATQAAGSLPLLQFALAELWDARDEDKGLIPEAALRAIGGVGGALARHADAVLGGLLPTEREAARRILCRLVTLAGTRARKSGAELCPRDAAGERAAHAALEALVRGRLLVPYEEDGETIYDLAHEALLTGWGTLREWLDDAVDRRVLVHRVAAAALEWERLGQAKEALWSERQLAEVDGQRGVFAAGELSDRELRFLAASRVLCRKRRWRRRALALSAPALLCALYGSAQFMAARDRDLLIAVRAREAMVPWAEARTKHAELKALRRQAFTLFDGEEHGDVRRNSSASTWDAAERTWTAALAADRQAEAAFRRAAQPLEAALSVYSDSTSLRQKLADLYYERILLTEEDHRTVQRDELLQRLQNHDVGGIREVRLRAPAHLRITTDPPGARVVLQRYEEQDGRLRLLPSRHLGPTPLPALAVEPGSYLLQIAAPGRAEVRLPILLRRDDREDVHLLLPEARQIPAGFVYVPAGRFQFGSNADEDLRRSFLEAPPLHEVKTRGYLIQRTEVSFAEWLAFLRSLPKAERRRHLPVAQNTLRGSLSLRELPREAFLLRFQPSVRLYTARTGELIHYEGRDRRSVQDWLRFPASAVSWSAALAYTEWLDRTGRVPGARLCDEYEWERAARGADGRRYPHGDRLDPDDANHDATYGRRPESFGPDEVGAHPASDSPFGVADLAGNVWEWVRSVRNPGEAVIRGGSWYQDPLTCRSMNRQLGETTSLQTIVVGMRICADLPDGNPKEAQRTIEPAGSTSKKGEGP